MSILDDTGVSDQSGEPDGMIRLPFSGSGYVPPPHPNPIHIGNGVYVRPERHGHIQDGYPHQSPAAQEAEMTSPKALDDATLAEWKGMAAAVLGAKDGPAFIAARDAILARIGALEATQAQSEKVMAENATLRADRDAHRSELDALKAGPYTVRKCRGSHWHVTTEEFDIGGQYDEEGARAEAAKMNAEWNVSMRKVEADRDEAQAENARLREQVEASHNTGLSVAVEVCHSRAQSLRKQGSYDMANEANKCASAIEGRMKVIEASTPSPTER